MKIIVIQPEPGNPKPVFGERLPHPFHVLEDGSVDNQEFWRGDPSRVVGFQNDENVQKVDVWWSDVAVNPELAVGKFPVMVGPDGIYTYVIAVESATVVEVSA